MENFQELNIIELRSDLKMIPTKIHVYKMGHTMMQSFLKYAWLWGLQILINLFKTVWANNIGIGKLCMGSKRWGVYRVIGILSCNLLSFINQFFGCRKEPICFTSALTQIVVVPFGHLMASPITDWVFFKGTPYLSSRWILGRSMPRSMSLQPFSGHNF